MARFNGYTTDDLIENPSGIIESLLRDEIHTERDLLIDVVSGASITINGSVNNTPLRSSIADYYNGAYLVNVTKNERYSITDYSNYVLTLDSTPSGWAAGNKCYIKNINCTIDTNSFDVIQAGIVETGSASSTSYGKLVSSGQNFLSTVLPGMLVENTTDSTITYVVSVDSNTQLTLEDDLFESGDNYEIRGKRSGWKFARSLTSQQSSTQVLNQLLFESHCLLFKSYNQWRLIDLGDGKVSGTLTTPLRSEGKALVTTQLTPLLNIYSSFVLNYGYDYTKKIYSKKITVDKNSSSNLYLDSYKATCLNAETKYKISRKYEYNSDWIQDDTTAELFLERLILWFSYQRLIVNWTGDIKNHIQYEIGDRVLINYPLMIPTSKNNSQQFQIIGKQTDLVKKKVQLTLLY